MSILRVTLATCALMAFAALCPVHSEELEIHAPSLTKWPDHSKSVRPLNEVAGQRYSWALIAPAGNGQFEITWACENGKREGANHDGRYKLEFKKGDEVLATDSHSCHLPRRFGEGHKKEIDPHHHLVSVPDYADEIKMSVYHEEPGPRPYERCPPGTVRPGPLWGPVCG
jgi:hypothetical protein